MGHVYKLMCTSTSSKATFAILHTQLWLPYRKENTGELGKMEKKSTKMIKGLEYYSYEKRQSHLELFHLEKKMAKK